MSELDEAWALGLAEAEARARSSGRKDVADYLALRSANDLIRKIGSEWLLKMFVSAAAEANRRGAAIQTSTEEAHRFKVGHAGLVGSRLGLTSGVRKILLEVGWPRTPGDGFIRGGGLACGHIKHVGIKTADEELRLAMNAKNTPGWMVLRKHGAPQEFHEANVNDHIAILLNDSRTPPKRRR